MQEVVLIKPHRPNTLETVVVGEHLLAVLEHRVVDRVPADPQVTGYERDRLTVLAHTAACPAPGLLREHGSGADLGARLPPRTRRAPRLLAAPDPLLPAQNDRPVPDRHVTDQRPRSPLRHRLHPTVAAERTVRGGLHQHNELVLVTDGVEEDEPVQSEKNRGRVATVLHVCGLRIDGVEQPPISRGHRRSRSTYRELLGLTHPLVVTKSPIWLPRAMSSGARVRLTCPRIGER